MNLHHFESFDSYAQAVFDVDMRVFLLGPRDGGWRIGHRDVDGIDVQRSIASVPYLCEGISCATRLTLLLPQWQFNQAWLNGAPLHSEDVGVLAPGKGFVLRTAAAGEWITIALPLRSDQGADPCGEMEALRQWASISDRVKTDHLHVDGLRDAALMAMSSTCPPATGRRLIEQRLRALIASRVPQDKSKGRPGLSLPRVCESTLAAFRDFEQTARADALCKRLRISERTLREVFQACFGMGPAHYLALRKLHDIYLDLAKNEDCRMTVADCFLRHGYPYSTYAASQYQALFMETPSQTRRRCHPRSELA